MPAPIRDDPYNLARFVDAQASVYERVCDELANGRKRTHWIWFIFPQLKGLGRSETTQFYGISSRDEARAFSDHPLLGKRLVHTTALMLGHAGVALPEIMPFPDDLKFISSMTLFAETAENPTLFRSALEQFANGRPDKATLALL